VRISTPFGRVNVTFFLLKYVHDIVMSKRDLESDNPSLARDSISENKASQVIREI